MTTAKNKGMRIKEVGATINLGDYSSLRVTIGEESEFAGLDLKKAQAYLTNIAKAVDGVLNLPTAGEPVINKKAIVPAVNTSNSDKLYAFGSGEKMLYDHERHAYLTADGQPYMSVTQLVEKFYPFEKDVIGKEYMDFAASYGTMVHTAIQNAVIGKAPKKGMVKTMVDAVLDSMNKFVPIKNPTVESMVVLPEYAVAGRFDILTDNPEGDKVLWDVKTNSDLFMKTNCIMTQELRDYFNQYWNVDTIYGEHCLQLNIYAYILEHHCGMKVGAIQIIHTPDGFKELIGVPKVDVTPILEAYKALK